MSKKTIYILDNSEAIIKILKNQLPEWGYQVVGASVSKMKAIDEILKCNPDIIIIDVNLNGNYEGIKFAKGVRKRDKKNYLILFHSANSDLALFKMAKEVEPVAYLIRPFNWFNIKYAIEMNNICESKKEGKVIKHLKSINPQENLHIKKMHKIIKVPINTITHITVESNYSTVTTNIGKFILRQSLKDLMEKLPINLFMRIHRNYLVNITKIVEYDFGEYTVKLPNIYLPIGKSYKKSITQKLSLLS